MGVRVGNQLMRSVRVTGLLGVRRLNTIYFMESEAFLYRDFGVQRCQDLPMKPWDRLW